ncbi:MAG: hypothetical protein RBJ76_13660 [Stenomitos frigidus ULC029]
MATIKLLGELGQRFGREWQLEIQSPAEAIRAIACQCPGFTQYLYNCSEANISFRVVTTDPIGLDEEQLEQPLGGQRLVIAPQISGSGNFGKILLGVALIGAAFLIPGGVLGLSATTIGLLGGALVLQGIAGILTSTPKTPKKESEKTESFLFSSTDAVGKQGQPVPILYGRFRVSNLVPISTGVTINEYPI